MDQNSGPPNRSSADTSHLSHRYPFLLVDRVVEYEQGKQAGECGIMYPPTRTLLQKSLSLA